MWLGRLCGSDSKIDSQRALAVEADHNYHLHPFYLIMQVRESFKSAHEGQ